MALCAYYNSSLGISVFCYGRFGLKNWSLCDKASITNMLIYYLLMWEPWLHVQSITACLVAIYKNTWLNWLGVPYFNVQRRAILIPFMYCCIFSTTMFKHSYIFVIVELDIDAMHFCADSTTFVISVLYDL